MRIHTKTLMGLALWLLALAAWAQGSVVVRPGQSIERAIEKTRKMQGEKRLLLRGGRHQLSAPIILTAQDSGLTIGSYPGESAQVTGARLLKKLRWSPYRDGIWQATLPADTALHIDMLIVNGQIAHLARYPNFDSTAVRFGGTSADATSPRRIAGWRNPAGGYLHAMHQSDWGDFHYRIMGKNDDGTLRLQGGHQNNRRMGLHRDNRMVEGIFEELDAPGEWFFERESRTLYYCPREGEKIEECSFEAAQLMHLFELRGSENEPVRGITLRRLGLTGTARTFMQPYEPLLRSDWTVYRGGALLLEGTEDCAIQECDLYNLGGNAVFFSRYNRNSSVTGCHITNVGASALLFVGDTSAVRSPSFEYGEFVPLEKMDFGFGPKNGNYPADCLAADNLIHHIGLFEKQITGVELSMCSRITVSHNSIYDVPRAGINISEGTWGGHRIEHNDIFDTVKETGDHGSFNSWGRDRYWHPNYAQLCRIVEQHPTLMLNDVVSPVVLHHNRLCCHRGWDIDLDDGSSNYIICDNLCLNGGIKLREGSFRTVENNILVNNTLHPHVWWPQSGDRFRNNIVMTPYQPIHLLGWGAEIDSNIFTSAGALAQAQSYGVDKNSICTQVIFVSPAEGDFRVANECLRVFRAGFHNFSTHDFGVVSSRLRAMAKRPPMPQPAAFEPTGKSETLNWHGFMVKSLDTEGERSATGIDSVHGVYVLSLADSYSPMSELLRVHDVIFAVNGQPVATLDDLKRLQGSVEEITLFRDHKELTVKTKPKREK